MTSPVPGYDSGKPMPLLPDYKGPHTPVGPNLPKPKLPKPKPKKPGQVILPVVRPGQPRTQGGIAKGGKGSMNVDPTYNTY